ncbi:MAG: NnrS family protein [Rhodospirillales bacterium]|nr:NnrS family protein [Rhodospirillales bacterium]
MRPHAGPALLAYGFRPFFLAAGVAAALALALWLIALAGGPALPTAFAPAVWHAHEMLFGFATAAIAGFLLTAIPNWTGRLPVQGNPLLLLVLLWLAGRLAIAVSAIIGLWPAAAIDLAFLAALLFVIVRELVAGNNRRNLPIAFVLALLLAANGLTHAEAAGLGVPDGCGWRLAIAVIVFLIALIGGRIVPSFTRNWLTKNRPKDPPPSPSGRFDQASLAATVVGLAAWVVLPQTPLAAALAAVAAIVNAVRLLRWQGHRTLADPLLLVLHVGYAWVPIGLALLALNQAGLLPETAAIHGFTAGAIGTMTLAVMTRATLGHTGRNLRAGHGTNSIFVLVTAAATTRVLATLLPDYWEPLMWISGSAWIAAFAGFVAIYGPMLIRPRIDGRPG